MTTYKIRQINGSAVKRFRKQLDFSVVDLAEKANLSKEAIYKIENGSTKTPTKYTIEQLADALLVHTDDILDTFSFEEHSTVLEETSTYTEFLAQQKKQLQLNIETFKKSRNLIIENCTLEFLKLKNTFHISQICTVILIIIRDNIMLLNDRQSETLTNEAFLILNKIGNILSHRASNFILNKTTKQEDITNLIYFAKTLELNDLIEKNRLSELLLQIRNSRFKTNSIQIEFVLNLYFFVIENWSVFSKEKQSSRDALDTLIAICCILNDENVANDDFVMLSTTIDCINNLILVNDLITE